MEKLVDKGALPAPQHGCFTNADTELSGLERQLDMRDRQIQQLSAELAHLRRTFNHASAMARIGVWECSLADNCLTWSDVIYDMFEIPRAGRFNREEVLDLYTPASRAELDIKRAQAIADCGSFSMNAEIITRRGNRRWLRITASVDADEAGHPFRIFGMKQDITEERMHLNQIRELAENDMMTGLSNRARFQSVFSTFCEQHADGEAGLMLIDLDGFKGVNDTFGHPAGDACLKQVAMRLKIALGRSELVARVGGDEFAALLAPPVSLAEAEAMAWRVVEVLGAPMFYEGQPVVIGASVGLAFGGGAVGPSCLFRHADLALYAAKDAGRNRVCLYGADQAEMAGARSLRA
ncbi:hypothetical protein BJF92_16335 [Rhizobium rhizosphaerae]|uniref:Diguanylate cyclase n=2 Tax=Xaviernesmea rhizosphaerae TaxID=1672749 RepID=A0A1Q9APX3_9HYPH|nr:hypothetical protein BJF92_16335 [Xaviernesmea rhizosphaerae]